MRTKKLWLVTIAALWCSLTVSAQTDVTAEYIANPSFEGGYYNCDNGTGNGNLFSPEGWTVTYTYASWRWKNFQPVSDGKGQDGNQYFEFWGDIYHSLDLSQEVRLPAGTYVLTAAMRTERADQVTNQHIYAKVGDNIIDFKSATLGTPIGSAWNAVDAWQTLTVEFTLVQTSDVTIGASSSGEAGSKGWFQIDNFRLTKTTIEKDCNFDEATGYLYVNKDYDYSSSSSYPWYSVQDQIKSVEFGPDVTSIEDNAFRDCSSLTTIVVAEENEVYDSRNGCNAIVETSSNTLILGCSTTIIPEGVTSIGSSAFSGCSSLTSITIPEGVTSIGDRAFYNCSSLTSITIPEGVTSIGDFAFSDCHSLTSITIPESVTSIGIYAFSGCSSLTSITIPENSQLTSIGGRAFSGCEKLEKIELNTATVESWFSGETSIKEVVLGSNVKSIGNSAFYGCSSLTTITIPENSQLTSIGSYAFYGCSSLTTITIPESVTSIGSSAFNGCMFSKANFVNNSTCTSSYNWGAKLLDGEEIGGLFILDNVVIDCRSNVTSITIPEGVTSIGSSAFDGCSSLTSITIPENSQLTSIGYKAFYGTAWYNNQPDGVVYLNNVLYKYKGTMPENTSISVREGTISISPDAFVNCSSLTSINIPESVTSIGEYAFCGCSSLTSITIPEGVTKIEYETFSGCSSLTEVYCYAERVPEAESSFFSSDANATLYVPASLIVDYLNTAPWRNSFGRIKALGETVGAVASGEYYLYHADSYRFLSRGEHWGTRATVDKYGIPFVWTADEYSIKFLDSNVCLFETDDSSIYTDNATTGFAFEEVEGGYLLKSLKSDRYLTIVDKTYTHQIVNVTDDASAAVVWQLKSKAEHDAIVAGHVEENYTNVIAAAGISTTAGDFANYLSTLPAEDKTSAIGTARFAGSVGDWTYAEVRHQEWQPAYGTDFCELWCATGSYTQTITNLPEGIYKVTMQGFERAGGWGECNTLGDKGYEITTATLSANGEEVNLKSWYSGKSGDNNPNNTGDAVAKFGEGKYMNEVYAYVGADGTLTLTVNKPSFVGDNWMLFNNFTLTRYAFVAVEEITLSQDTATLIEGDTLTLVAVVSPDNATDKTVTWSTSDDKVATVDENGKIIAVAPGTVTITAISGKKSATCEVFVDTASYVFTLKVEDEEYFTQTVKRGTNLATLMAEHEVATPTKEGYTFSGWEVPDSMPANDVTVIGSFAINSYTLTYTVDGDTVQTDSVVYNTEIIALEEPTKEGYTFSGWSEIPDSMPASNVTISGAFTINTYLVTFKIGDAVIAADSLEYNATIVVPEAPEKEGYTFNGWGEVAETVPADDLTYEGSYSVNSYKLAYMVDGEVVQADSVAYGTEIIMRDEPTKEGYTFSGWSESIETMPAKDVTISGNFTINSYTLTYTVDGDTVQTDSVVYNTEIVALEEPTKEGYTFSGWSEIPDSMPASDVTISGSFAINSYTLTYTVDGKEYKTETVVYGTELTALPEPVKEGYTFSGWSELPDSMPARDVICEGYYTINMYQVTFTIDGVVLKKYSLEYGAAIVLPNVPELEGYTFSGWDEVPETVPAYDVTYEASYIANIYMVYYFVGAQLVHSIEVAYGDNIPEYVYEPTGDDEIFVGWVGEAHSTMPARDLVYTANVTNGINLSTLKAKESVFIFDLTGRRVLDTENLKSGLYIINGKKTVIK